MISRPYFSIIIPVYNGGEQFERCLEAVQQSTWLDWELIVVDDGSSDGSDLIASQFKAHLFRTAGRRGPATARNIGAQFARGTYLFFTDADCRLQPDTLARAARYLEADPDLDALFGSYDDAPVAPDFIAQYKNLFHHYVHQHSHERAATFWTGCGAVNRAVFLKLGGFDSVRYKRPSIEDIDFGHRLTRTGGRIRLAKDVQVTHLKAWSLVGLLKSDILDRGLPWTRLLLRNRAFVSDLNLQTHNRASVLALYGFLFSLFASFWHPSAIWLASGLVILLLGLNQSLYRFFYRQRGLLFVLKAIPIHWLYYFYNALAFSCGLGFHWLEQFRSGAVPAPKPLVDRTKADGPG